MTSIARRPRDPAGPEVGSQLTINVCQHFEQVTAALLRLRPAYIINLVGGRRTRYLEYALFSFRLARFLATTRVRARLLLVGSAAEYGHPASLPVDEMHPVRPVSEYGLSMAVQSWMGQAIHQECGLPVLIARIFNVVGPGQSRAFFLGSVVAQAVDILMGSRRKANVGNVDSIRDFIDVRDAARALEVLATRGRAGEIYNVCSGRPARIKDILQKVQELCCLSGDFYTVAPERCRDEVQVMYGSNRKIVLETGWSPAFDIARTIGDMIDHERAGRLRATVKA